MLFYSFIYNNSRLVFPVLVSVICISCKKLVAIDPPITQTTAETVYNNDASAVGVLNGIYASIRDGELTSKSLLAISLVTGLSGDELALSNDNGIGGYLELHYLNELSPNANIMDFWSLLYSDLYNINSAIEGLNASNHLTQAVKRQLLGEAKFMRAFYYFYLVNLYGDVPLVTNTEYKINSLLPKSSKKDVFNQIKIDLLDSKDLLSEEFLDGTLLNSTEERIRPTKWAASALLARLYLFNGDWVNAESEASLVINQSSTFSLTSIDSAFLKNNEEAIFQIQSQNFWRVCTSDAYTYIIPNSGFDAVHPVYISPSLLDDFEVNDQRRIKWIDSVTLSSGNYKYPFKYKDSNLEGAVTEHSTVIRLAELYLIRSEARVQQGKTELGLADLNVVRARAGLQGTTETIQESLLATILHEKKVELFCEWGHRWFDLKRSGNIDSVMSVVTTLKGGIWNSYQQLYPISFNEIQRNPSLKQNTGY